MRLKEPRTFSSPGALGAVLLTAAALALAGCNDLPARYCALGGECDDPILMALYDPVPGSSPDSVDVCTVNQETFLAALRANREDICHRMAEAWEEWMLCVVEEDTCRSFRQGEPDCKDERREFDELARDAGNRCNE
jgi:hypothetical protein